MMSPVALNLGETTATAPAGGVAPHGHDVPPALRAHRPGWRAPRLWIGIVLVAACVVVGARVLAAADDTVQVCAAAGHLGAGQLVLAAPEADGPAFFALLARHDAPSLTGVRRG